MIDSDHTYQHDHSIILMELKSIREDLKELMQVTRADMKAQDNEISAAIKELRDEVQDQRLELATTSRAVAENKKVMYMVGTPALFVAISAMAKAMGFI